MAAVIKVSSIFLQQKHSFKLICSIFILISILLLQNVRYGITESLELFYPVNKLKNREYNYIILRGL